MVRIKGLSGARNAAKNTARNTGRATSSASRQALRNSARKKGGTSLRNAGRTGAGAYRPRVGTGNTSTSKTIRQTKVNSPNRFKGEGISNTQTIKAPRQEGRMESIANNVKNKTRQAMPSGDEVSDIRSKAKRGMYRGIGAVQRNGFMKTAATGAVMGGAVGGTVNAVQGEDFWEGAAAGTWRGAALNVGRVGLKGATNSNSLKEVPGKLTNALKNDSYTSRLGAGVKSTFSQAENSLMTRNTMFGK